MMMRAAARASWWALAVLALPPRCSPAPGAGLVRPAPCVWAGGRAPAAGSNCCWLRRLSPSCPAPALPLRGGADTDWTSQSVADEARKLEEEWEQLGREWEYCMVPDHEGIGRALHPDPVPCELPHPTDDSGGPEILNLDGTTPGPEVWRNPPEELRAHGWVIDPATAPVPLVIEHGLQYLDKQWADMMHERKYGPDISHLKLPKSEDLGPGDLPHLYWDRDGGTRPFVNVRDQLPAGWRQLKFAGSSLILAPDYTFVHNDDPFNTDINSWGADPGDRGRWALNGATWEESSRLMLYFNDRPPEDPITLKLHCEERLEAQTHWYTGEHQLDEHFGEVVPNLVEGNKCDESDCPACDELLSDENPSELEEDGHELPPHCFEPGGLTPDVGTPTGFERYPRALVSVAHHAPPPSRAQQLLRGTTLALGMLTAFCWTCSRLPASVPLSLPHAHAYAHARAQLRRS